MNPADQPLRAMANILLAKNLATSLEGSSRALSPKADRVRFHQIRARSKAILIGGQSYINEPYERVELPLYISSRQLPEIVNGKKYIYHQSPAWLLKRALSQEGGPVLIEGGINFLSPLIESRKIDLIYITRVELDGDGHFFDELSLLANYERKSSRAEQRVIFEVWALK